MLKIEIKDLLCIYDNLSKGVKNKKKLYLFENNKVSNIYYVKYLLDNNYDGGKYNMFLLTRPKHRIIMSQNLFDKTINHYVAEFILKSKLNKYLDIRNVATRENTGTSFGINLFKKYLNKLKLKHKKLYVLKLDIKNYFFSIDHEKLKSLFKPLLNDDEYILVSNILSSTNVKYVNEKITSINIKNNLNLPLYKLNKGLPIGNMTSQFLAIFYLYKLHTFIINELKIKYFVNYMDDYVIIHHNKGFLKTVLNKIKLFLNDYSLSVNENKTNIVDLNNGVIFLGYKFILLDNKKIIVKLSKSTKNNIIKNFKLKKKQFINKTIDIKSYLG